MTDEDAMRRCLALAEEARGAGEAAVGCVILQAGVLLAEARESVRAQFDPTAHAELLAIRAACVARSVLSLRGCVLFSNVEPCHMCSYAIREVGIGEVVFLRRVGDIGGTVATEALLLKGAEDWGEAPVVRVRDLG